MNQYFPLISEIAFFAAIICLALLATIPVRRRLRREYAGKPLPRFRGNLLRRLSFPLAVAAITLLVLWAGAAYPPVGKILPRAPSHVASWLAFFLALSVLDFLELAAIEIYALRNRTFPIPTLLRNIIRFILLLAVAFLILRLGLGIDISPLLASTALLTAVIGFALQGVLGNLLAGMSLHLTKSLLPSDWVAIGDAEGQVIQTNWRETRLRTTGGHIIVVPNSAVAAAEMKNFTSPTPLRRHNVYVGASYSDAPGEVIAALVEAALEVPAVVHDPAPSAYVTEFKDFGINYVLRYWTNCYYDRIPIDGDVGRMIWYKFKRRGIEIPFPMSDKLLNDFMEVVYTQRRLQADEDQVRELAEEFSRSELVTTFLADEKGAPLLSPQEIAQIARSLKRVPFTRGETLFRQGEEGDTCYIVLSGKLEGRLEFEDNLPPHAFEIGPGALVGEMSLMTGLPRTATVAALTEVELLMMDQEAFTRLLSLRAEIPERLSRIVAERAARNAAQLENLKALKQSEVVQTIRRENIFKRFLKLLGRG
ncbi:MAG: mechanosensitive ion channel family protein [Candidatus Aureabacteria bacterium]|nr:mechanosensitive ion channel family protein [Candidatus Auribacterota bacterium]